MLACRARLLSARGYFSDLLPSGALGQVLCTQLAMKVFANGVQFATFTVDFLTLDKNKTSFTATGNKGAATTGMAQFIWQGVKR